MKQNVRRSPEHLAFSFFFDEFHIATLEFLWYNYFITIKRIGRNGYENLPCLFGTSEGQ